MAEDKEERQLSITFKGAEEAPRVPTSGVYGGISNDGMVWAALYHEHGSIPDVAKVTVDESGQSQQEQEETIKEGDGTRDVQVITQMSPRQAISIGKWLIQRGLFALKNAPQPDFDDIEIEIDRPNGRHDQGER